MRKLLEKLSILTLSLFIFCLPTLAQSQNADAQKDEVQIRFALQNCPKIAATGEMDKFLYYFTDDAMIMGPGQPTIKGKQAIQQMIEGSRNIPGFKMEWDTEPSSIIIAKGGDLAYVLMNNKVTMNDPSGKSVTQLNKAVLIWRKEPDQSWKEAVVIFNEEPTKSK